MRSYCRNTHDVISTPAYLLLHTSRNTFVPVLTSFTFELHKNLLNALYFVISSQGKIDCYTKRKEKAQKERNKHNYEHVEVFPMLTRETDPLILKNLSCRSFIFFLLE